MMIIEKHVNDKFFSNIFLIIYLLYPYLLGHGFFNTTDIPFLFAWILSTFISTKIFVKIFNKEKITIKHVLLLSFSTSLLLSIRISGLLILLQFFIFSIITAKNCNISFYKLLKSHLNKILFFIFSTLVFTILFYPLFWKNPLIVLEAVEYLRNIPYGVCTLTLGSCMDALNLPSSYIFIWLFFKLPILAIVGFVIFPFIEKKIFSSKINQIT